MNFIYISILILVAVILFSTQERIIKGQTIKSKWPYWLHRFSILSGCHIIIQVYDPAVFLVGVASVLSIIKLNDIIRVSRSSLTHKIALMTKFRQDMTEIVTLFGAFVTQIFDYTLIPSGSMEPPLYALTKEIDMALSCGIVGLPNVGKSTLFNALTKNSIPAENYPFCTIEPNEGVVQVPDNRLEKLNELVTTQRVVPTAMKFVDIAGLVKGASEGEGLGNQFLGHIRQVNAIIHVVRCFTNTDVVHVDNHVNPVSDIDTIEAELCLADIDIAERAKQKAKKLNSPEIMKAWDEIIAKLTEQSFLREETLSKDAWGLCESHQLLMAKPMFYLANCDESLTGDALDQLVAYAEQKGADVVKISSRIESEISQLDEEDQAVFLAEAGLEEPGLHKVIREGYKLLNLKTFFTVGEKEIRAWTYVDGATAQLAAGVIHTDFIKGFIRAEIISYTDFISCGGEASAKEQGKWRLEGKAYLVQDGDVIHFRVNA